LRPGATGWCGRCCSPPATRAISFLWLTFRQTTEAVIEGFEAAAFFGGVFGLLMPENLKAVVDGADALEPWSTPRHAGLSSTRSGCATST
jgi:hypothetical protein